MTKCYGKAHGPCLVGPHKRGEYAQAVRDWLDRALPFYSRDNVQRVGCEYVAHANCPPPFAYDSGLYRWSIQPGRVSDVLLLKRGDFKAARRQLYGIALGLLEEARPCDRQALRQRMKDEAL